MVVAKSRNVGAELREYLHGLWTHGALGGRVLEVVCASVSRLAHLQELGSVLCDRKPRFKSDQNCQGGES